MSKRQNPDTSNDAYYSLDPDKLNALQRKLYNTLKRVGSGTYEDLAFAANIQPQQAWKRCSELLEKKMAYRSGEKRMLSSNRLGFVWFPWTEGAVDIVKQKSALKKTPSISDHARALQKASRKNKGNNNYPHTESLF